MNLPLSTGRRQNTVSDSLYSAFHTWWSEQGAEYIDRGEDVSAADPYCLHDPTPSLGGLLSASGLLHHELEYLQYAFDQQFLDFSKNWSSVYPESPFRTPYDLFYATAIRNAEKQIERLCRARTPVFVPFSRQLQADVGDPLLIHAIPSFAFGFSGSLYFSGPFFSQSQWLAVWAEPLGFRTLVSLAARIGFVKRLLCLIEDRLKVIQAIPSGFKSSIALRERIWFLYHGAHPPKSRPFAGHRSWWGDCVPMPAVA
jgi:hypothetical protein